MFVDQTWHGPINVLETGIYSFAYNTNKPDGQAASSWARARRDWHKYTPLEFCNGCRTRKTPKKMGYMEGLCFACSNKKKGLFKRCKKFLLDKSKGSEQSGTKLALRKMLSILYLLDTSESMVFRFISTALASSDLHLSLESEQDFAFFLSREKQNIFRSMTCRFLSGGQSISYRKSGITPFPVNWL